MVNVARVFSPGQFNPFFLQEVMNVHYSATREDTFKVVFFELMQTRTAADQHGIDILVVQSIGNTVEKHSVSGDNFFALLLHAVAGLRIAAA